MQLSFNYQMNEKTHLLYAVGDVPPPTTAAFRISILLSSLVIKYQKGASLDFIRYTQCNLLDSD